MVGDGQGASGCGCQPSPTEGQGVPRRAGGLSSSAQFPNLHAWWDGHVPCQEDGF